MSRTIRRSVIHLVYLLSCLVGDDIIGKKVRLLALRACGARVSAGAYLHGGSYVSEPRHLVVGARTFVNRSCYIDAYAEVTLGVGATIGHGVTILTSLHDMDDRQGRAGKVHGGPVAIGDGAWIGANVTILPGLTIGPGAVVGAGSIVTHDVEANCAVAGNPARLLRRLEEAGP